MKLHEGDEMDTQKKADAEDVPFDFDIHVDPHDVDQMGIAGEQKLEPELSGASTEGFGLNTLDESTSAAEEPKKSNIKTLVIVGVVVGSFVIAFFVYFAMSILGGDEGQSVSNNRTDSQFGISGSGSEQATLIAGNGFDGISTHDDALALDAAINGASATPITQPSKGYSVVGGGNLDAPNGPQPAEKDIVITYAADSVKPGANTLEGTVSSHADGAHDITDEERLYDNLLTSVDGMNVPPEAIKIDQSVINRRLESQRLQSLETDLGDARQSISAMSGAVENIKAQVAGFSAIIEKSSEEQAALTESLNKLTDEIKHVAASQDKEFKALRDAVSKAQARADQAASSADEARKVASQAKQVNTPSAGNLAAQKPATALEPARTAAQVAQPTSAKPLVVPSRVFASATAPRTVQAPVAEVESADALCSGTRFSTIWRVKGVNNQSAYIVRSQDEEGIYLKRGVEVPGFGQVISFDAANRTVCTTSGLIRR
ncbi:hypothetical protein [Stutzerimonas stutzeri]|uniref:hypothetical protein n=1 Tax=Stutzerimonas stutzeri TaxID=316 RepID=UPI0015E3C6A0|nr:hypothetical protein [Stutzerimonas stutzeri]MBA1280228.1 hypothetical protein [Stutzerimonas stutzeri]